MTTQGQEDSSLVEDGPHSFCELIFHVFPAVSTRIVVRVILWRGQKADPKSMSSNLPHLAHPRASPAEHRLPIHQHIPWIDIDLHPF